MVGIDATMVILLSKSLPISAKSCNHLPTESHSRTNFAMQLISLKKTGGKEEHWIKRESNVETADFPSLQASSIAKVLNVIIEGTPSELPQIIETASLLPDFYPAAKSKLYVDPTIVSNFASARRLLSTILENESTIDLGAFDLTIEQIFELLNERLNNPTDVIGLSFSGNPNITEEFLREILVEFPRLEFLYLLSTPQIPLSRKIELLRGTTVQLYDTELLALPLVDFRRHKVDTLNQSEAPAHGHIKPVDNCSKIMPGEWTLAVIGELYCDPPPAKKRTKVRYAFVTAAPPMNTEDSTSDSYVPEFVIEDIRGFLDSTIPDPRSRQQILEGWNKAVEPATPHLPLGLSGRQEVESLIRALLYPVTFPTMCSLKDTLQRKRKARRGNANVKQY
ncbi:predicted protein [Sclerotinia sclerotiorum 1980 UF-70]|uniref:Uncharacterized protein n=1 Tax=Sclerotinia sclerotiorum (strain ATCC 18683 / 1980 / Ss-1) TaxID=665079 RepID=A7E961_SCLS1|nr:predicted protein [Sclerotinia sclerotiorum 1980 UF-70]EDN96913.1 predicted protein [Sclerotinia sclerotiorum 1980 UF-70]